MRSWWVCGRGVAWGWAVGVGVVGVVGVDVGVGGVGGVGVVVGGVGVVVVGVGVVVGGVVVVGVVVVGVVLNTLVSFAPPSIFIVIAHTSSSSSMLGPSRIIHRMRPKLRRCVQAEARRRCSVRGTFRAPSTS